MDACYSKFLVHAYADESAYILKYAANNGKSEIQLYLENAYENNICCTKIDNCDNSLCLNFIETNESLIIDGEGPA